jgi:hypothetical protein
VAVETSDRFKITCEVDVGNLGPVMVRLAQIEGLAVTGSELVTEVLRYNRRPQVRSQDLLVTWIQDHPTFSAGDAVRYFIAEGRTATACYPALAVLVERGLLKKLAPGKYSRTDIKAIEGPATKKKKQRDGRDGKSIIMTQARRNHGRVNTARLIEVFAEAGRARNSVYASIDGLLKSKQLKRVGDKGSGQYVLLKTAVTSKKTKPLAKTNGALAEVTDHG